MKKAVSGVMMFNIIIVFLLAIFAILAGTFSYAKAYKVNSRITNAIEKYAGYNSLSISETNRLLKVLGYSRKEPGFTCPAVVKGVNGTLQTSNDNLYMYCVYKIDNEATTSERLRQYYSYYIITYIKFKMPIIGDIKFSIKTKTNRLYRFDVR